MSCRARELPQVDKLFEGLTNLSPHRLMALLGDCRSVKVKRLFFFFAARITTMPGSNVSTARRSIWPRESGCSSKADGSIRQPRYRAGGHECRSLKSYRRQAALLLRALPYVAAENCFALKRRHRDQSFRSRPAAPLRRYRLDLPPRLNRAPRHLPRSAQR